MKAYGLSEGMKLQLIPIRTVGLSPLQKYKVWLFEQRRVRVLEAFEVPRPNGGTYLLPEGFEFNGGSVPRWLLVAAVVINQIAPMQNWLGYTLMIMILTGLLIERFGLMLAAFAVHDFAVRYGVLVTGDGGVEQVPTVRAANDIMRRVNFATNDMIIIGWIAHMAVVAGAWMAWRKYRKGEPISEWKRMYYGVELKA